MDGELERTKLVDAIEVVNGRLGKQIRLLQMYKKRRNRQHWHKTKTNVMTSSVWGWETASESAGPLLVPGGEQGLINFLGANLLISSFHDLGGDESTVEGMRGENDDDGE